MIGAALLLAGAGAASLAAAANDTNGNGLALNGSDTLFDVTTSVITTCSAQSFNTDSTGGDTYKGGGSGVGAGQMLGTGGIAQQALSPMSRAFKNTEFCATSSTAYGSVTMAPGKAEGLLVGIDGVAIAANQTNSCSGTVANGFGAGVAMSIQTGGTGAVTGSYTFGDSTAPLYKNQPSFDALAVLYFGLTHDGQYSCSSDTRKSLIKNWKNLFQTDCTAGDGTCTAGLTHAWRRSDLSGTTDAFVSVLNPPAGTTANGKGAAVAVGIGTLATVPVGVTQKSNPFCNTVDATSVPATLSFGGDGDFADRDPVRTACGANSAVDDVCQAYKNLGAVGNFLGDMGVVLPILLPDSSVTVTADLYPTQNCSTSCTLVAPIKTTLLPGNYLCPGSNVPPNQGFCFMPVIDTVGNDPRCISNNQSICFDVVGKPDGRQYNMPVVVSQSQFLGTFQKYKQAGSPFQFAVDINGRPMSGSFYRVHSHQAGNHNVPDPTGAGTTGLCKENDDTSQIGCLTDSDPCSIGYAGRESAKGYPGLVTGPTSQPLKALAVNGTTPFTPASLDPDPDKALKNLLAPSGTTPLYPLARRLYFNTIFGFGNLQGGEKELAQCYGTNSIIGPAISSHGFVAIPSGVQCLDYPEQQGTGAPLPNVQGSGNVALGGCAASSAGTDACSVSPPIDITGATVPEATEAFGP
jgi:ABC-type phosphate transport system substrate-binding protein